jgi:hypothetical protein
MKALVELARKGFRQDGASLPDTTTTRGEYRGRPAIVHRVAPTLRDGRPTGYYFKWYTDPDLGAIVAFERGPVDADGRDVVEMGEQLEMVSTYPPDGGPTGGLDWQTPPKCDPPMPTATLDAEGSTPAPGSRPSPTPSPAQPSPTPTPPIC